MEREINIFDKIGSLFPGYSGYAERNNRRQCDRLLRDCVVERIVAAEKLLSKRMNKAFGSGEKNQITGIEECRKKLNTLGSKIKFSPYGESAFFSCEQLKENELAVIYQKDHAILEKVGEVSCLIPDAELPILLENIEAIEGILDDRNEFIKRFK
jgi:hypothetical protein